MTSEFELIGKYFTGRLPEQRGVHVGIGDDCALIDAPAGTQLAVTVDTMVAGVHFFPDAEPADLGHKILAVNLSDLSAMGAQPFAVTLAMTLPQVDEQWLAEFSRGFLQLAQDHAVALIGGDTTSGPLSLTVQALGTVPAGRALLRCNARPGDLIYLTGPVGDAGLGLKIKQGRYHCADQESVLRCLHRPSPKVQEGLAIRDIAHACIDVSDGLAADLRHIIQQSGVGASVYWERLPLSPAVLGYIDVSGDWLMPLTAGDDYQLCFTVPAEHSNRLTIPCVCIGEIEHGKRLKVYKEGQVHELEQFGFEHFN